MSKLQISKAVGERLIATASSGYSGEANQRRKGSSKHQDPIPTLLRFAWERSARPTDAAMYSPIALVRQRGGLV